MAQVPYTPYPTAQPSTEGTPSLRIEATPAMFGANVAQALEGLGKTAEGVGNEIFGRAVAIQQLNNETEAKEADAQYMIAAGEEHTKFQELQGLARVNAYKPYVAKLQSLRQQFRSGLSNDMARRMYDSTSLGVMGRSIFNAAGAAGTAGKEAAQTAATSEQQLITKNVYNNPDDEFSFRDAVQRNHESAVTRAALMPGGASPERVELLQKEGDSQLAYNRIIGMARSQPYKASQLLKQYMDEGLIWGQQAETALSRVQSYSHTVGMDPIANEVLNVHRQPDGSYDKTFAEMQQEAKDKATKLYPDDPAIGTAAAQMFDKNYNQLAWAKTQDKRDVDQQINNYIVKGVENVGLLPPDVQQRMTPAQIKAYPVMANAYRRAIDRQTDEAAYNKLLGLYNNDNGKFMDTSILKEPGLSKSNINFFLALQRKEQAGGDPRVARAIKWIQGARAQTLQELGVYKRTTDNMDDYDKFTGALHEAIQAYQETYEKAPGEKEVVDTILPAVLTKVTQPGWIWNTQVPFFRADLADEARAAAMKDEGKELTDIELRQRVNRLQFMKLFGEKKSSAPKDQGRVGQ